MKKQSRIKLLATALLLVAWGPLGLLPCHAAGDFNGDGKDDIITFVRDSYGPPGQADIYVALSTGTGFGPGQKWHDTFGYGLQVPAVCDFNGDGKDDVIAFVRDTSPEPGRGDVWVTLSTGSSFTGGWKVHEFFCIGAEIPAVGDFNGDGKDDIITFLRSTRLDAGQGDVYVALSNGSIFQASSKWHDWFCIGNEIPAVGDFNGDGKDDIATFLRDTASEPGRGDVYVALSDGTKFVSAGIWHSFFCISSEIPAVGDFTGDGKDDIVTFTRKAWSGTAASEDVYVAISNGSAFLGTGVKWHEGFGSWNWIPDVGDFTGDGKDDICCFLHDTTTGSGRGDVRVARSTSTRFEFAGPLLGKWHDWFCILEEVPTTFAAVFPYYVFNDRFEDNSATAAGYVSDEEERFVGYVSDFKQEFQDTWPFSQYYWGQCYMLGQEHLGYVDSVDIAFLGGHGSPASITLCGGCDPDSCNLSNYAWGSWSSHARRGDLEYIAFESCKVTNLDGNWWERWESTPNKVGPFSGLHVACGFHNNHQYTPVFSLGDEFAENLEDGFNVRWAWMEATDDEDDYIVGHSNIGSVIYLKPHKNEKLSGFGTRDYWYHDPQYQMQARYWDY